MKALIKEKQIAIKLRKQGKSLNDICYELGKGKSTVFSWIRNIDVKIKRSVRSRENLLKGTKAMQAKYRKIREQAYKNAYENAEKLLKNVEVRDLIVAYFCEGCKTNRNSIDFVNTDPSIHKMFLKGIKVFTDKKPRFRIICHEEEKKLKLFWSKELGINKDTIKIQKKKGNKGKYRSKYGTFTIIIDDTIAKQKLDALIDWVLKQWNEK